MSRWAVKSKRVEQFMKAIDLNGPRILSDIQVYQSKEVRGGQGLGAGAGPGAGAGHGPTGKDSPPDRGPATSIKAAKRTLSENMTSKVLELRKTIDFGPVQPPLELTGANLTRVWGIEHRHPSFSFRAHDDQLDTGRSLKLVYFYQKLVVIFFFKLDQQEHYRQHQHPITALALSTDSLIASADFDSLATILVWNLATRETLKVLPRLHFRPVTMLEFFGGNRYLFTVSFSQHSHVLIYDLTRNEVCLSFLETEVILEVSDPARGLAAPAPPSRLAYITHGEVHLLTSRDKAEGIHFERTKCSLARVKNFARLTALLATKGPDDCTELFLGHENGAVTMWRDFDYQYTLTVYEAAVHRLLMVPGVGLVVHHGDIGLSMWNHAVDKQYKLLDSGNLRLLKLPFQRVQFCVQMNHRLYVVTDFLETVQVKFAPRTSFAGKKRIKRLLPILQPRLDRCEFFLKARAGQTQLVFLVSDHLIGFYDVDSSDFSCSLHFREAAVLGFDVQSVGGELLTAVATADGCLHLFVNHELKDQLACFAPEDFVKLRLTSNPDFVALLLTRNRVTLRGVAKQAISRIPPTTVSLDEAYMDFFDLRYHKKGQKLSVFSTKNVMHKVEDLKGRTSLSMFGENNFFSKKFLLSFYGSPGAVAKCLLCRSGLTVMTNLDELRVFGNEKDVRAGAYSSLSFGDAPLTHLVLASASHSLFCGDKGAIFRVQLQTQPVDVDNLDLSRALVLKKNALLDEEVRVGRRVAPPDQDGPAYEHCDSFAYGLPTADHPDRPAARPADPIHVLRSAIKPFKSQDIGPAAVEMFGKRFPLTWLRLKRICGFQALSFRNNLAYAHLYQSNFLEPMDAAPVRPAEASQRTDLPGRLLDDLILSRHKYYPYDRQHKACAKEMVYFVSKYAVLFDPKSQRQRFYSCHDHPITALAVSSSKALVATGDSTSQGACGVRVWRVRDAFTQFAFTCQSFERTLHLRFSNFDEYLAAVGANAGQGTYHLVILDVANRSLLAAACLGTELIFDLHFNNYVPHELVVAGMNLIRRLTVHGSTVLVSQYIRLGKEGEDQGKSNSGLGPTLVNSSSRSQRPKLPKNLLSFNVDEADPRTPGICVTVCQYFYYLLGEKLDTDFIIGTSNGEVGIVAFGAAKFSPVGHRRSVNCIKVTDVMQNIVIIISAAEDGCIKFWNTKLELISELDLCQQSFSFNGAAGGPAGLGDPGTAFNHSPQSIDIFACDASRGASAAGGKVAPENYPKVLLVGTRNSEIVEVVLSTEFLGITTQQSGTLILNRRVLNPEDKDADLAIFDLKKKEKIIFDAYLVTRFNSNAPHFSFDSSPTPVAATEVSFFLYGPPLPIKEQLAKSLEASRRQLKFELTPDGLFCLTYGSNCDVFVWNVVTQRMQQRFLTAHTPLAVRFLPHLLKMLVFTLPGRLLVYSYQVDSRPDDLGGTSHQLLIDFGSLREVDVDLPDCLYLDVSVVPNYDVEDEGSLSQENQSSNLESSDHSDSEVSRRSSRRGDRRDFLREFTLFFHQVTLIDGLKYDQMDLEVLRSAVLVLAKGRPPKAWKPYVGMARTLRLPYLKGHPLFVREASTVMAFMVDKVSLLPDGNVSIEVKKRPYVSSVDHQREETHYLLAALEEKGSFEFKQTLSVADEATVSRLDDLRVTQRVAVKSLSGETVSHSRPFEVTFRSQKDGTEFYGTREGAILVSKPPTKHVLVDDRVNRPRQSSGLPPPPNLASLPTQLRVVPAHAALISKMELSAAAPTLLSLGANENCLFFWEIVKNKPYYDLDGLFYDTHINEIRFQEASSPRAFEVLVRTWRQIREEMVHLKDKVTQDGGATLSLDKVIGRTALDRRNNMYISYDNKLMFCVGSLVCLMSTTSEAFHQDFLMQETQMPKGFISPPISTFAVSTDRRFMVVGTTELPSRLYFWEICYKVCYCQMVLDDVVQVVKMEYSPEDLFVIAVCLTKDYTQSVLVLTNKEGKAPAVLAACELRYSPVFKILAFAFKPDNPYEFVTAGEQHLCRWKIQGEVLLFEEVPLEINEEIGKVGNYHQKRHRRLVAELAYVDPRQIQSTFLTVSYVEPELLVTGSTDGTMHFWHNYSLIMIETGHQGAAILSMATCPFYKNHILTGGADGLVNLFKIKNDLELNQFVLERLSGFKIAQNGPGLAIQSLVFVERMIFAGGENGDIYQFEMAKLTSADTVKESNDVIRPFYRCWSLEDYFRVDFSNDTRYIYAITKSGYFSVYATRDLALLLRWNVLQGGQGVEAGLARQGSGSQKTGQSGQTGKGPGSTQTKPAEQPAVGSLVNMVVCQLNPYVLICYSTGLQALHAPHLAAGRVVPAADLDFPAIPGVIFDMKVNRKEDLIAVAYTDSETQEPNIDLQSVDFAKRTLTPVRLATTFASIKFIDFSFDNYYLFYHDEMANRDHYISLNEKTLLSENAPKSDIFCLNEGILHSSLRNRLKEFYHDNNQVNCIVRLSDATCIVADAYGTVRVFEVSKGSVLASQVYTQHLGDTNICRLSSDQKYLLTASKVDKSIFVWRVGGRRTGAVRP